MKTVFIRALEADDKEAVLQMAIHHPDDATGKHRFEVCVADFASVPGSPFAYWVSTSLTDVFRSFPSFDDEAAGRATRCGLGTLDDWRFLRLTWEVPLDRSGWATYYHGGVYSPFYDQFPLLVRWEGHGQEVKAFVEKKVGSASRKVQGEDRYFTPGFVFPRRTKALAPKVMASGGIFSTGGQAGFTPPDELLASIALLSSRICSFLISLVQGRTGDAAQFEVGLIKRLPWPYHALDTAVLASNAHRSWSLKRGLDSRHETSHAFVAPALLQVDGDTLVERAARWAERVRSTCAELQAIQDEIDQRCFDGYGIREEDRRRILEGLHVEGDSPVEEDSSDPDIEDEDFGSSANDTDPHMLCTELVAWAVGVAVGRFDVRLATGALAAPAEPDPFDPLPRCAPGVLGISADRKGSAPPGYPIQFPTDGILVDDPGHPSDLVAGIKVVFEEVFGADASIRWHEVSALLDPRGQDLRNWLRSDFFEHHIKRYSKSRRKGPILWQLGVGSGVYSVWLYLHRLTRDSLFQLQNDVVVPKLAHEERRLTHLAQTAGGSPSATERKEIAVQESLVEDLRTFLDEIRRVAPLWNPTLDDGVLLTMAPLWRMVPRHKAWQRELKVMWDALCAGKYDWAHLAMYLWPERVVPKCATDRSLAIAHGLEEYFWTVDMNRKWTPRETPTRQVEELIRERTSPAVKAALAGLLDAPVPAAGGRSRKRAHV